MDHALHARSSALAVAIALPFVVTSETPGQCTTQWQTLGVSPLNGAIHTIGTWDPDGPGPLPARVVAGGGFTRVSGASAGGIAAWDPATSSWSAVAGGTDGIVHATTGLSNGDLVVAGPFTSAGGRVATGIARWNGVAWAPLGAGLTVGSGALSVKALVELRNGDLVVAGNFTAAGGQPANGLARWSAGAWSAIPATLTGGGQQISSLVAQPNGDIVVGGTFTAIGGVAATNVARWDGARWASFGVGLDDAVSALAVTGNGSLVAASVRAGSYFVSRWNGAVWTPLAGPVQGAVLRLAGLPGNGVLAGGLFSELGGTAAAGVAAWNGVAWSALGTGPSAGTPWVDGLAALPSGYVLALDWNALMHWDGTTWRALNPGIASGVRALIAAPDGEVYVGGSLIASRGFVGLARREGGAWAPIAGSGVIEALARRPNGNLIAGGASFFGEWNGTSWSLAGNAIRGSIRALLELPGGDVLAGGEFQAAGVANLARWDGTRWSGLAGSVEGRVEALSLLPNGDVVAGGLFTSIGGVAANSLARWDGVRWAPLGSGVNARAVCLAVAANGDLFVGGSFSLAGGAPAPGVARWNGSAWASVGAGATDGVVLGVAVVPNGDLVAVGDFTVIGGASAQHVARWNGVTWSALGAGLNGDMFTTGRALAFGPRGLYVAGSFDGAGGVASTNVALLASTCPSVVQPAGNGCFGRTLTVSTPWLGSTLRTEGRSLGGPAAAALVLGFAPTALPLASVLPTALPGCALWVQPDLFAAVSVNTGLATTSFALPKSPALAGIVLRQQMIAFEIGGASAVTATNALALTLGAF